MLIAYLVLMLTNSYSIDSFKVLIIIIYLVILENDYSIYF